MSKGSPSIDARLDIGEALEFLRLFIVAYLRQASRMSYPKLRQRQGAPTSNLYHGAAGLAYTFWRAGVELESEAYLEQASRWSRLASQHQHYRYAFRSSRHLTRVGPLSIFYGRAGLPYTEALLAHTRGQDTKEPIERFLALYRPRRLELAELMQGAAGYLCALSELFVRTKMPHLYELGVKLSRALTSDDPRFLHDPWVGFAHGQSGVWYSLIRWSKVSQQPLPQRVHDALSQLTAVPLHTLPTKMPTSWCNGAAGLLLLWVEAYQQTHDLLFLQQAKTTGRFLLEHQNTNFDLCCGLGGAAYSLLLLEKLEPGVGWIEEASRLCVEAVQQGGGAWPNGLFRGYPGLVCLALDILKGEGTFPLIA